MVVSWSRWKIRRPLWTHLPKTYLPKAIASTVPAFFSVPGKKFFVDLSVELSDAIRACSRHSEVHKIHARLISSGLCSSLFLLNTLLHSYIRCNAIGDARLLFSTICTPNKITHNIMVSGLANYGHLDEAIQVFDQMPARDSVSWNSLMSGYFRHGCFVQTMHVFVSMFSNSIGVLDVFSLAIAMKACGALQFYRLGLQLHGLVEKLHFGRILHINRSLIDMHIKCGFARMAASIFERMENPDLFCWNSMIIGYMRLYGIEHALMVFSNMPKRDTISWNTIISLLLQQGHYWETMSMILDMHTKDFSLSSIAYACGLGACTRISDLAWGKHLHARIVKLEPSIDVFVGTALVDMYAKNGDMDTAKRTFDSLPDRNTTTWTSFIGGFAQNGYVKESAAAFNLMRQKQVWVDEFTLSTVISACYNGVVANIHFGCQMHCFCVKTGNCLLTPVSNALLTMYARCEMLECAESIFHAISSKDVVSWTGMITAQAQVGNIGKAREFFSSMDARNVVTWNAIFGAYIQNGMEEESLKLFVMMLREDDVRPDWVTFVRLIAAAADMGALKIGTQIISHTMKLGLNISNTSVANGIITMYSKSGKISEAQQVFDSIAEKDLVSWNAMITSYAQHGLGKKAVETFDKMLFEGFKPDFISYVAVLSGCSHSGLVTQGKFYFNQMTQLHAIAPGIEHFACMVDLLARAGFLEEAKNLIQSMPMQPTSEVWGALLGACKIHKNAEIADYAAQHLLPLDSNDSGSYILLAKLYADVGCYQNSAGVWKLMKERGIRKKPGCSWIEVENRIHVFIADDISHPQIDVILTFVEELIDRISAVGYATHSSCSRSARHHSEKLALAFGLMSLPQWMPIHIMKNLRICSDCHTMIKLVSLVCEREFVVRDAIRFHHFNAGSCSCREYW